MKTFIYKKILGLNFVRFIYFGLTIYKHFLLRYLYNYCIFDFNQIYGPHIQYIVVGGF